jgi:hypothetical protein
MNGSLPLYRSGCQSLAATAAPSITAMGIHIVLALATIMLVWFGVQEALASAQGGAGFSMGRFLNLFMLLTFAYAMVNYYDSSIPGLGFPSRDSSTAAQSNLVNVIGSDGSTTMLNEIHAASSKTGPSMLNSMMSPYYAIVYFAVQFLLALLAAIVSAIVAYGAIAARSSDCSGRSSFHSLSSTSSIGCSGDGSRLISDSAFTRSLPRPR